MARISRIGDRTRLACWFESLAVASHPLQRRPRRNCLLFNHEDHGRHEDWRSAGFADLCRLNKESRMRGALSQFPLFRIEANLCKSGPRESANNNFSASFVSSPAIKPGKIPGFILRRPDGKKHRTIAQRLRTFFIHRFHRFTRIFRNQESAVSFGSVICENLRNLRISSTSLKGGFPKNPDLFTPVHITLGGFVSKNRGIVPTRNANLFSLQAVETSLKIQAI